MQPVLPQPVIPQENKDSVEKNLVVRGVDVDSNLVKLVEQLTQQQSFLTSVEEASKKILENGTFDFADVPTVVHLIVNSIENVKATKDSLTKLNVTKENLSDFVKLVFEFVVTKYKLVSADKVPEYERMLVASVNLVLLVPNLSKETVVSSCLPQLFNLCVPQK